MMSKKVVNMQEVVNLTVNKTWLHIVLDQIYIPKILELLIRSLNALIAFQSQMQIKYTVKIYVIKIDELNPRKWKKKKVETAAD